MSEEIVCQQPEDAVAIADSESDRQELYTVVSDETVDAVVAELNQKAQSSVLGLALEVGETIIRHFYGGDLTLWRRRGRKDASFRKLARRRDLQISASGLYRSVAVYDLHERLGVAEREHLTISHLRAVLGLPEEKQRELLGKASEEGWTSTVLEEQAAALRAPTPGESRRGRPPLPPLVKAIGKLERILDKEGDALLDPANLDHIEKLDVDKARHLREVVASCRQRFEELEEKLAARAGAGAGGQAAGQLLE